MWFRLRFSVLDFNPFVQLRIILAFEAPAAAARARKLCVASTARDLYVAGTARNLCVACTASIHLSNQLEPIALIFNNSQNQSQIVAGTHIDGS